MSIHHRLINTAELLWQIPLGMLSFAFFKISKLIVGKLYNWRLSNSARQHFEWLPLSSEILKTPLTLPFWMTFGPRLNTHAIIATVGPFSVEKSLKFSATVASKSAKSWTIAVYKFPNYQTVIRLGYGDLKPNDTEKTVNLPPGRYLLGLRYYNWSDRVELPAVTVDGRETIESKLVPNDINNFYSQLSERENWFYFCLHYYLFPLFRLKNWLPKSFVKREFLPVGDPALVYYYGLLLQQERLKISFNPILFKNYEVYLTLYDRASFVMTFYQIQETNFMTEIVKQDSFYLFRIRQKPEVKDLFVSDWIDIETLRANLDAIATSFTS